MPDGIWGFVSGRLRALARPAPRRRRRRRVLKPANAAATSCWRSPGSRKHFGGLKAVDDIDLAVRRGGVHALIGPNGSGKTTTLNVLSGLYTATAGTDPARRHRHHRLPPHERTAAGLGRTFQNIRLFRSMTALENVIIGAEHPATPDRKDGHAALAERAMRRARLRRPRRARHELVTSFSYGHQRLIEIARALAGNPTLLLLDEPAAGLNSTEKLELRDLLKRIAAKGLTILIIDHDMTLVSEVAEHITVLNFGRRIADGVAGGAAPSGRDRRLSREPNPMPLLEIR